VSLFNPGSQKMTSFTQDLFISYAQIHAGISILIARCLMEISDHAV
jgi:hypothetical protein